jgi:hypothetical protein
MNRTRAHALLLLLSCLLLAAPLAAPPAPPSAAGEGAPRVSTPEDLFAVITLRGQPCGKVVSWKRRGENDYEVTCRTGDRYRVYVDASQRVVVQKR